MEYILNEQLIRSVIRTLKGIDVRGYESMDALVGLVVLFEQILKTPIPRNTGEIQEGVDNSAGNDTTES